MRGNKDTCTPELVTWGASAASAINAATGGHAQRVATVLRAATAHDVDSTQSTSVPRPVAEQSVKAKPKAKVQAVPDEDSDDETAATKKSPPRNKLPKIPLPSALGKTDWFRK